MIWQMRQVEQEEIERAEERRIPQFMRMLMIKEKRGYDFMG